MLLKGVPQRRAGSVEHASSLLQIQHPPEAQDYLRQVQRELMCRQTAAKVVGEAEDNHIVGSSRELANERVAVVAGDTSSSSERQSVTGSATAVGLAASRRARSHRCTSDYAILAQVNNVTECMSSTMVATVGSREHVAV